MVEEYWGFIRIHTTREICTMQEEECGFRQRQTKQCGMEFLNGSGITDTGLNYVLPNMDNFGCRLFSESDLYVGGTHTVRGCGGDKGAFSQTFYVNEPRLLTGEEQKSFCAKVIGEFLLSHFY